MASPQNIFAFDPRAAVEAAYRYKEREAAREDAARQIAAGRYDQVDSKERLAKRANRLLDKVRAAARQQPSAVSDTLRALTTRGPVHADTLTNDFYERVIGETRDFLSSQFLSEGAVVLRSIGRIVTTLGGGRVGYGTGFLVSPRLLLTNWHVFRRPEDADASFVEFNFQVDNAGNPQRVESFRLRPAVFFLNDRALDFALAAVDETSRSGAALSDFRWCPLIRDEGKIALHDSINIVQHPRGEMKQVVIRKNELVDLLDQMLHYEGDTEPGSSGSPLFNDQWEVVGLHHSGIPKTDDQGNLIGKDGRTWHEGDDPDQLAWVSNEGIRVSRIVAAVEAATIPTAFQPLREQLLRAAPPSPAIERDVAVRRREEQRIHEARRDRRDAIVPRRPAAAELTASAASITVPLKISISVGGVEGIQLPEAAVPRLSDAQLFENAKPDDDYDTREGYDADFLGFHAPLPSLEQDVRADAFTLPGGSIELRYHHYSVIFNKRRRIAFVSAVNFDANPEVAFERQGADKWFFDPRVPKPLQAGDEIYVDNPLDRGHLTRRADAAWGDSDDQAESANNDTFHFTNCSPQHEVFNQSSRATHKGLRLWGNLENHVAAQAKGDHARVSVFNGPIFRQDDRSHRGLQVPREFWKLIVYVRDDGTPGATAFILSQASLIQNLPEEEFEPGPYQPFQVSLSQLAQKTKLDFGSLAPFDPLLEGDHELFVERETGAAVIRNLGDIHLGRAVARPV